MNYFLAQLANGLIIGFIYALMALGLTLIYGIQRVVSFAHGEFYMLGGYTVYYLLTYAAGLNPFLAIPVAGLVGALLGVVFERLFLHPIHRGEIERPGEYGILVTFGLSFFLQNLALAVFGPYAKRSPSYFATGLVRLFGFIPLSTNRLTAAGVAILLIGLMLFIINRTWIGKALRAVSQDRDAAAVVGIDPLQMNTLAFGLGCGLAALAGATLAPVFMVVPWIGAAPAARSFVIIVLGGMGSIPGALLGGLTIGLVETLGAGYFPDPNRGLAYQQAYGLVIFALILLLRPRGLFGRKE